MQKATSGKRIDGIDGYWLVTHTKVYTDEADVETSELINSEVVIGLKPALLLAIQWGGAPNPLKYNGVYDNRIKKFIDYRPFMEERLADGSFVDIGVRWSMWAKTESDHAKGENVCIPTDLTDVRFSWITVMPTEEDDYIVVSRVYPKDDAYVTYQEL